MPQLVNGYIYPTSIELGGVDQALLPVLANTDPIFEFFPLRNRDSALVAWEQRDDYTGLQQMRGQEGEYPTVPQTGINRYEVSPGHYGESDFISGREIEERRGFGQINQPISVGDLIAERHQKLATRQFNRMSWVMWTLLSRGSYIIPHINGAIVKKDAFTAQSYAASVAWSSHATATPLADFRAVQLKHRGISAMLGSMARAFMTLVTFNNLIANTNAADLGGRRGEGLSTIEGLDAYNRLISLKDNLPGIVVFDEGYKSDGRDGLTAGTFYTHIPDNVVIVIGRRTNGAAIGEFQLTRNADNPDVGSTPLVKVVDTGARDNETPPRKIGVFRGWNGGPAIWYGGNVVVMTV